VMDQRANALRGAGVEQAARESRVGVIGPGHDLAAQNPANQVFFQGAPRGGGSRRVQGVGMAIDLPSRVYRTGHRLALRPARAAG